jgi:hypothetical protein
LPTYLKSRAYIDFLNTANLDTSFNELIRHEYNEPKYKKPPLGIRPSFTSKKAPAAQKVRQEDTETDSEAYTFSTSVFLNASFDKEGLRLLKTQIFAVIDCGFVPRSLL